MATSGTYSFSMDIDEVIQEAMEMIGGEATLGEEPRSARRSINLLLQDWQNRGIQLWTIGTTAVTVTTSTTSYDLGSENIDVLGAVVNSTDVVKFETVKYIQDVTRSNQTADVSRRFLPCLTAGTAYFMSMKRPGVDAGRIQMLKQEYEERLMRAQEEDKERASMYITPRLNYV